MRQRTPTAQVGGGEGIARHPHLEISGDYVTVDDARLSDRQPQTGRTRQLP